MYLVGALMMAWNFFLTIRGSTRAGEAPALATVT
jgi:cbb3-type cytochrome oxidase subunit 1